MKRILVSIFSICFCLTLMSGRSIDLTSPDGSNTVTIETGGPSVKYSLTRNGDLLLSGCEVSMTVGDAVWGAGKCTAGKVRTVSETVDFTVQRKYPSLDVTYNTLTLKFKGYSIEFRAYDEGIAYRFVSTTDNQAPVKAEKAVFSFAGDWTSYTLLTDQLQNWFEFNYSHLKLSELPSDKFSLAPVMVEAGDYRLLLSEANLYHYSGLYLKPTGRGFEGLFAYYPEKEELIEGGNKIYAVERKDCIIGKAGKRAFPWRVVGTFDSAAEVLESELVYALSDAPDADADYSWIRPGKVLWDWWNDRNIYGVDFKSGINTDTYKYLIDYAARHGIEYILIDEGWSDRNDLLVLNPDVDMPAICEYAAEKGVGVQLWAKWVNVLRQMDDAFRQFSEWGVKGVKIDFMDRNDAKMVDFYETVAAKAAEYRLLVDFHGSYPNEGMRRKYPNLMTREGVLGLEYDKWSDKATVDHDVTIPFIRMWAGPMDYTPGAMLNAHPETFWFNQHEPMSQGTRSHQLAMYVVYESPLQMVSDSPSKYDENPESFEFIKATPTVWDETIGLCGEPGEYVAMARRSGDKWFVGVMNGSEPRSIEIPLGFLGDGDWTVSYHADGVNAASQAKDFSVGTADVHKDDVLKVDMARGGGYMAIIQRN